MQWDWATISSNISYGPLPIAPDIPVYEVQMEGTNKKTRTLHCNMLLPLYGVPNHDEVELSLPRQQPAEAISSADSSKEPLFISDSSDDNKNYSQEKTEPVAKYVIPPHRDGWQYSYDPLDLREFGSRQPLHRGKQKR